MLNSNDLHMCDVKSLLLAFNSIYVVKYYRWELSLSVCVHADGRSGKRSMGSMVETKCSVLLRLVCEHFLCKYIFSKSVDILI